MTKRISTLAHGVNGPSDQVPGGVAIPHVDDFFVVDTGATVVLGQVLTVSTRTDEVGLGSALVDEPAFAGNEPNYRRVQPFNAGTLGYFDHGLKVVALEAGVARQVIRCRIQGSVQALCWQVATGIVSGADTGKLLELVNDAAFSLTTSETSGKPVVAYLVGLSTAAAVSQATAELVEVVFFGAGMPGATLRP